MNMHRRFLFLCAVICALLAVGCEEKPPLVPAILNTDVDTAYVQISPSFAGFTRPEDIIIGNDQLLYVADTYGDGSGRVVMLNRAGQVLSSRRILRPLSIAQDSRLDLLVGGLSMNTNGDSIATLYRIHLVAADHHLENAAVDTIWRELARPDRRFPGITIFGDNTYLVVRDGPDNSSFVDPDALLLQFDKNDQFVTPIASVTTRTGSGITDIYHPSAIVSFSGKRDFVLVQQQVVNGQTVVAYGALWMVFQSTTEFEGWLPKFDPQRTEDRSKDFIRPNRYRNPQAVTIDKSRTDIFVADAALDSVFKYNSRGTLKAESFGFSKTAGEMIRPTGLAYFDRVLYVLDGARGEVLKFRLTTDVPR
jgi:hypothetical protein